jgi:hypothetical protein
MALSDDCEAFWALTTSSLTDAINSHVLTATNMSFEAGSPGPCRIVDSSGASILRCSTITLAEPFTMAAQVYVNGGAAGDYTFMAYARDGTNYFQTYQTSATNKHYARSRAGGTAGDADGGDVAGSTFNNCGGVWTGSTSRQSYLASTLGTANTTSVSPSGAGTHVSVGGIWDGSSIAAGASAGWRFKNFAVWSRALSDAELDSYFSDPTQVLGADVTAPTLSSPISAATGKDAGSGTVTTNEPNGTLYSVVTLTSTPPNAAQVKAGQNASGTLLASGLRPTQSVSSTGAKTVAYTGLTTTTAYFPYFAHEDSSGNISTVSAGASFTPSTLAYSGTVGAQIGVQGAAFVFSGANPSTLFSGGIGSKSYSGTGLGASGLTVNSSTGVLSGTCGTPGTYTVAIVGTDQSTAGSEIPQTETSNSFTLTITASGDTTRPTLGGVVTISSVTSSSATATWSAGSDNSGTIAGYDYQVNGGSFTSLGNVLTVNLTGLTASTAYTVNVRARDPSGNVSTPVITGGFTTSSGTPGTFVSAALKRNNGTLAASSSLTWVTFLNPTTGAFVVTKTALSTNSAGVFSTTDAALTTGTYHAVWLEATGQRGWGVASVA